MGVVSGFLLAVLLGLFFIFWFWSSSVVGDSGETTAVAMPTPRVIVIPAISPTPTPYATPTP